MFGSIGITELILIGGIALIFLGPEKFPEFAKIMARTVRDIRGYVQEAQRDITEELKPVKDELDKLSKVDPEAYLEKLADSGGVDEEWDSINLEPDESILKGEESTGSDVPGSEGSSESDEPTGAPEGAVAYEAYDQEAADDDSDEAGEDDASKRELDG